MSQEPNALRSTKSQELQVFQKSQEQKQRICVVCECEDSKKHTYKQTLPQHKISLANFFFKRKLNAGPLCNDCFTKWQVYQTRINRYKKRTLQIQYECNSQKRKKPKKEHTVSTGREEWKESDVKNWLNNKLSEWKEK